MNYPSLTTMINLIESQSVSICLLSMQIHAVFLPIPTKNGKKIQCRKSYIFSNFLLNLRCIHCVRWFLFRLYPKKADWKKSSDHFSLQYSQLSIWKVFNGFPQKLFSISTKECQNFYAFHKHGFFFFSSFG